MLSHYARLSRPALGRAIRPQCAAARRTFIVPTAARQADLIQDMYLHELRKYKSPPVKPSDAHGHVQKFTPPAPPKSPEEGDLTKDLKAYEEQQVEVEGQAGEGEASVADNDWFEEEEDDEPKAAH